MLDIHSHILPGIDDGSVSEECSLNMIEEALENGVTDIICTPHYRRSFKNSPEKLREVFNKLIESVKHDGLNVNLYLGEEIFVTPEIVSQLNEGQVLTLNNTKYVLLEFDYDVYMNIASVVKTLVKEGYIPVIAHPERYRYVDNDTLKEVRASGGVVQVNTNSIIGKARRIYYKKVKGFLKEGLVDFVASDAHCGRVNTLNASYEYIKKKFGNVTAEKLFNINASKIIGQGE